MMNLYLPSGGATERVRRQEEAESAAAAKKSCSTGDIHQEEAETLRRRLSLPGLLSQGRDRADLLTSSYCLIVVVCFR